VPPGRFTLKLRTAAGNTIDLPDVELPPNDAVDLGVLTLN
jgi:hypothetical protein